MSNEALDWALEQQIPRSAAKFVLVVFANHAKRHAAFDGQVAWLGNEALQAATALDRKTIILAMKDLRDRGFLVDTGKRKGSTGQCVVYQLKMPKNGTLKEAQKRDALLEETVPITEPKSPKNGREESRFSREESQKRDTNPLEPVEPLKGNQEQEPRALAEVDSHLPSTLTRETWQDWCQHVGTGAQEVMQRHQLRVLETHEQAGHSCELIVAIALANGWKTLHAKPETLITESQRRGESPEESRARVARMRSAVGRCTQAIRDARVARGENPEDDNSDWIGQEPAALGVPPETVLQGEFTRVGATAQTLQALSAAPMKSPAREPLDPKVENQIAYIHQQRRYGKLTAEEASRQVVELCRKARA
jgi:hypothetical protein